MQGEKQTATLWKWELEEKQEQRNMILKDIRDIIASVNVPLNNFSCKFERVSYSTLCACIYLSHLFYVAINDSYIDYTVELN